MTGFISFVDYSFMRSSYVLDCEGCKGGGSLVVGGGMLEIGGVWLRWKMGEDGVGGVRIGGVGGWGDGGWAGIGLVEVWRAVVGVEGEMMVGLGMEEGGAEEVQSYGFSAI